MPRPQIFSIEGNIGSGKTTIIENLQRAYANNPDVVFIREPVDIWMSIHDSAGETILAKFYHDQAKYAFNFQIMAYWSRLSLIRQAVRNNPTCKTIICERSLDADKHIFAKMLFDDGKMDEVSYKIYTGFHGEFRDEFALGGVVYIDADPEVCMQRISKRARIGEETVPLQYLEKCRDYHEQWLNADDVGLPVLKIKTNENVTYDTTRPSDKGLVWMTQIVQFISLSRRTELTPVSSEENIFNRVIEPFEEFFNPNL